MGNCLVQQEKVIEIMKTDGKILEYRAPMKVHQVLSEFSGHAISDTLPVYRYLQPDTQMIGGHLYYLLPEVEKKVLRFSNPAAEGGQGSTGVVRIKLVITKQELKEMLRKGGVGADDMVSLLQNKQSINGVDHKFDGDVSGNCKGWKPLLESIPEVD